jgi:hypothetical protein
METTPRPSFTHKLALGLPVDGTEVRLGWFEDIQIGDTFIAPSGLLQQRLCDFATPNNTTSICLNEKLKESNPAYGRFDTDHSVYMIFQKGAKDGGRPSIPSNLQINRCVHRLLSGTDHQDIWRGPIVLISRHSEEQRYQDVSPADFRLLLDMLGEFSYSFKGQNSMGSRNTMQSLRDIAHHYLIRDLPSSGLIQGVRVNCNSDMHFLNTELFIDQQVPRHHSIFDMAPTSASQSMKLPIIVMKLSHHVQPVIFHPDRADELDYCRPAVVLNIKAEIQDQEFWAIDSDWKDFQIGSVCIVRQDRKPITTKQVEALYLFQRNVVCPKMGTLREEIKGYTMAARQRHRRIFVEDEICEAKFQTWFENLLAIKSLQGDKSWTGVVSPFKV